ncbi:GDSL esterase/lipase At3g43570-like [Durio zibethinus]|uniref:GDSL esterase/lipase At3g43570-like n=1 Tax=Durio zibethinus TaxID=66656 RepID=A0A6P6AMD6_DURZI|nr:GDSL esterase/lipase At3g43570-like [Durio zibethinus]
MPSASSNFLLPLCAILVFYNTDASMGDVGSPAPGNTQNQTFSALLAFGDSILDTGNNNNLFTVTKCNFPPYGRDFPGGKATGRFGNGKVFSDLIGSLGIKPVMPAFLDPNFQNEDLETGACFASGGSGLDKLTARIQNILSITDQFNLFKQYVAKLEGAVGAEKANATISNSLFLTSSGNNDIGITYFSILRNDINQYTTQLVGWASSFLKVKDLLIFLFRILFNIELKKKLKYLSSQWNLVKGFAWTGSKELLDLIQNPNKYGFDDSTRGCCGTGTFEVAYMCNQLNPFTCPNTSNQVFWDTAHPSERAIQDYCLGSHGQNFTAAFGLICCFSFKFLLFVSNVLTFSVHQ